MLAVLGMWEEDWMDPERTERRIWKQTIQAFSVDIWAMCPRRGGPFTSPIQYDTLEEMLVAFQGPRTFFIPPGRLMGSTPLSEYKHPEDGIYVFGNSPENLVKYVGPGADVVSIYTPGPATMFAHAALGAVLYDRLVK